MCCMSSGVAGGPGAVAFPRLDEGANGIWRPTLLCRSALRRRDQHASGGQPVILLGIRGRDQGAALDDDIAKAHVNQEGTEALRRIEPFRIGAVTHQPCGLRQDHFPHADHLVHQFPSPTHYRISRRFMPGGGVEVAQRRLPIDEIEDKVPARGQDPGHFRDHPAIIRHLCTIAKGVRQEQHDVKAGRWEGQRAGVPLTKWHVETCGCSGPTSTLQQDRGVVQHERGR
jgi:hypothetical protein